MIEIVTGNLLTFEEFCTNFRFGSDTKGLESFVAQPVRMDMGQRVEQRMRMMDTDPRVFANAPIHLLELSQREYQWHDSDTPRFAK